MRIYEGSTADEAWSNLVCDLTSTDSMQSSRCGPMREFLQCAIVLNNPSERWIRSRSPAYNPAFGLVEFLWILSGENRSDVLKFWNPQLSNFSGESEYLPGAYGYRLRSTFNVDQIKRAYNALKANKSSRQVVLQIWNPSIDLPDENGSPSSPDIPCNITSILKIQNGRLYWTQIMRSNDVMRGLPYNLIQFTLLHECFASWLGCELGDYVHLANSMHLYEDCLDKFHVLETNPIVTSTSNHPRLTLSFDQTESLLQEIYQILLATISLDRTRSSDNETFIKSGYDPDSPKNQDKPECFKDILAVIGSDAALRLGYEALSFELAKKCTNPILQTAANSWLARNN